MENPERKTENLVEYRLSNWGMVPPQTLDRMKALLSRLVPNEEMAIEMAVIWMESDLSKYARIDHDNGLVSYRLPFMQGESSLLL